MEEIYNLSLNKRTLLSVFGKELIDKVSQYGPINKFEDFLSLYLNNEKASNHLIHIIKNDKDFAEKYCDIILYLSSHRDDFEEILSSFDVNVCKFYFSPLTSTNKYNYYKRAIDNKKINNIILLYDADCIMGYDEFDRFVTYRDEHYAKTRELKEKLYVTLMESGKSINDDYKLYEIHSDYCENMKMAIEFQLTKMFSR